MSDSTLGARRTRSNDPDPDAAGSQRDADPVIPMSMIDHLKAGLRPAFLFPRARLIALIGVIAVVGWSSLRGGGAVEPGAEELGAEGALALFLEQREGLIASRGGLIFLSDPIERPWSQGRDYVPALATLKPVDAVEGEVEDLYYLEVRATRDGTPVGVRRLTNLTSTPSARERVLARSGESALLAVEVFGQTQSLLMVDTGKDERDISAIKTGAERWRHRLTNLQQTGRLDGVGMRIYGLDPPPSGVEVSVEGEVFKVVLRDVGGAADAPKAPSTPDLLRISMVTGEIDGSRATYQPRYFASKSTVPWVVDTIRDMPWMGERKVALLEQFVFGWKDTLKREAFEAGFVAEEGNLAEELGIDPSLGAKVGEPIERIGDWPPADVKPGIADPAPGEGRWSPVTLEWLRSLPGAPPAFFKTAVRMDPDRPYDNIVLIAMDMHQLDLGMVAGTVTPESSFGNRGDGLMPRDPAVVDRLVAAFNGGFKTAHGAFGMMVNEVTIMPAMPFAATIAVDDRGRVLMGSWNNTMTPPQGVRSFRQNLPPLIADGKFNPTGKRKWGGTASDLDGLHTPRSGVAVRGERALIFAWCKSCSADALGQAMIAAGCDYGMHLDMNPTHTGFSYYRADTADLDKRGELTRFEVERGSPAMDFRADRYIQRDVKDFFYLTLRRPFAETLPAPPEGFAAWDGAHSPNGHDGLMPLAAVSKGLAEGDLLIAVELPRLGARMRRGDAEPDPTRELGQDARAGEIVLKDPAMLIDLGVIEPGTPSGFFAEGRVVAPLVATQPVMALDAQGLLRFVSPDEADDLAPGAVDHLRGGAPIILDGQPATPARAPSGRVHALGVDAAGRLFVTSARNLDAARASLLHLGVTSAILLPGSPNNAPRFSFLEVEGQSLVEIDPLTGQRTPASTTRGASTHLYLERRPDPARVARLLLEDVTLSEDEAKRQKRLQTQILALREEMRLVENAKYRAFQDKLKERRETPQE